MKIRFLNLSTGILLLTMIVSGVSCSKEKTSEKAAPVSETPILKEDLKMSIEESKKVVVAKVNGVDLTMKELLDIMNQLSPLYKTSPGQSSTEIDEKVKKDAVDLLVFRELALQEAKRQKLKVASKSIDETIQQLKSNFASENAYREYLEKSGFTEAVLRNQIEKEKLFEMITLREITGKSKVDEKLVKDAYTSEKAKYFVPENFFVEDVFIQTGKEDGAAMNKAREILALLKKNGEDVSKLPADKAVVVRTGGVTKEEYPKIFGQASKMKPGELSGVITESDGQHIVKVIRKESARQLSFEEAKGEIERKLMAPLMDKRKLQWESELKKNAKIEIYDIKDIMPVSSAQIQK